MLGIVKGLSSSESLGGLEVWGQVWASRNDCRNLPRLSAPGESTCEGRKFPPPQLSTPLRTAKATGRWLLPYLWLPNLVLAFLQKTVGNLCLAFQSLQQRKVLQEGFGMDAECKSNLPHYCILLHWNSFPFSPKYHMFILETWVNTKKENNTIRA